MTKKEAASLLVAFGICDSMKQARTYTQNKTPDQLREIEESIRRKSKYMLLND